MQDYIIHSFKKIDDNSIWTRQETGSNSGGYVNGVQVKRLNDFLCDGGFKIHSVYKGTIGSNILTVGDRITTNHFRQEDINPIIITNIKIELSTVVLFLNNQSPNNRVLLNSAVKYVEPVAITTKQPVKRTSKLDSSNGKNQAFLKVKEQIEAKVKPIRLERTLKKRKESIQDFLVKFFVEWNNEKNTVFVEDPTTIQTESGKRRSLGDIYMIVKYYYPNITINELLKLLYNVVPTLIDNGFRTSYCNTIHKRVWYYDEDEDTDVLNKTQNDEFGNPHRFYIDNIQE